MLRSSCAVSAVVAVTSVQPTSEKRTVRQLGGSAGVRGMRRAPRARAPQDAPQRSPIATERTGRAALDPLSRRGGMIESQVDFE